MAETHASYLSIGEVLGLLLEEFPDVTISKIRFLESQGLISPERTASGYRKFYEEDIELLRVILTEQRHNYLPLRVIKDRLENGEIDPTGEHLRSQGLLDPTPLLGQRPAAPPSSPPETTGGFESRVGGELAAAFGTAEPEAPDHASEDSSIDPIDPTGDSTPAEVPAARVAAHPAARFQPVNSRSAGPPQLLPGVLVDRNELCAMASITIDELEQLESFGIVVPTNRTGTPLYDEDALSIARPAGQFLRLGVDARHLRTFRTSAEREAGLYEQLVTPRYRQRNPEARSEALRQLRILDDLGGALRAAITRHTLRHHFDA